MVSKEKKTKGFYSIVAEPSGTLSDLVPYSKYKMFMVVANNAFEGPPSNTVEITTKEGGEDARGPSQLRYYIQERPTSHVVFTSVFTDTLFNIQNHDSTYRFLIGMGTPSKIIIFRTNQ